MPILPGDDILLRSHPQRSKLFLVVQQPERWEGSLYGEEFLWYAQINGTPTADIASDLTVDNGGPNATLLDRMTVLIGSSPGAWDKGIYALRGDQNVTPATVTLDIGQTSEIDGNVEDDDYVTVLDEFRLWMRKPRITEAAGTLTWYKDWDLLWSALGGNAAQRAEASLPPVPIMGPHAVRFVPTDASAWVDWDASNSYATYPGATVNAWTWAGERDSGAWASAAENPAPVEYTSTDISGLAGYRVTLEVGSDVNDPPARYRRGVRYVFTLRRPGQRQAGDPVNAEPIVNFEVGAMRGTFTEGRWSTTVRVFDSDAAENVFLPGALVIFFADDYYAGDVSYIGASEDGSVGPIRDRENVIMVGRIADGTIRETPETGEITFDVLSIAQQAQQREQYPIAIENNDDPTEWYHCPDLTLFRAVWHYAIWHTTLPLIADFYQFDDDVTIPEVLAQDFLAQDLYSAIDRFLWDRRFGRLLYDRYERGACRVDAQMKVYHSIPTLIHITSSDWLNEVQMREVNESPTSLAELGGVIFDNGLIIPYLSNAPGNVSGDQGRAAAMRHLAILSQVELNTLSGRYYARLNNRYPETVVNMAGNWRVGDLWPQEYVIFDTLVTQRKTFADFWTILREVTYNYVREHGYITTQWNLEADTDGPPGETIEIPETLPDFTPYLPSYPPYVPPTPGTGGEDSGVRIIGTDVGVFITYDIGATSPYWRAVNNGLTGLALQVYDIGRDPYHWWAEGATKTLWALTGDGLYQHVGFPYGTWVALVDRAALRTAAGDAVLQVTNGKLDLSIEEDGRCAFAFYSVGDGLFGNLYVYACVYHTGALQNTTAIFNDHVSIDWPDIKFAQHSGGLRIFVAHSYDDAFRPSRLVRTVNGGAAWVQVDTIANAWPSTGKACSLSVPYISAANPDDYILWKAMQGGTAARRSVNGGAAFADVPGSTGQYRKLGTGGLDNRIWMMTMQPGNFACRWSNDSGVTWTTLPLTGVIDVSEGDSFVVWSGDVLISALIGYTGGGLVRWVSGDAAWASKTGNLGAYGPVDIYCIDRDSEGAA